jgi:glutaredoxin
MQSAVHKRQAPAPVARASLALFCAMTCAMTTLALAPAPAWALYKVVGPDGKTTYTDRPPSDQPIQALKSNGAKSATEGLPFELQRVAIKYPVTLYTSTNCTACDTGRELLKGRGVPFQEKTIVTPDDIRAFSRLEGTDQLPVIRIGQKQIIGLNQTDWTSYIDAAGYPVKSALPPSYKWPVPSPLAPPPDAKAPATEGGFANPPPRRDDGANAPAGSGSPPGFRF